ncbi:MAG: ATP-binding protein [Akkermansiaceae bacterium]|nr:ATP-binding protein [Akkermansiaceae bacterium]
MTSFRTTIGSILLLAGWLSFASAATITEPLQEVSSIRCLTREEAAKALPVKLKGVVVYQGWHNLVVHDGKASIYVDFEFSKAKGFWQGEIPNLKEMPPGTELELEGVTDPGGFSPMVLMERYRSRGMVALPAPRRPSIEMMLSSSEDTQWVEVEGVVRKYVEATDETEACLHLVFGGYHCPVMLRNGLLDSAQNIVDAKVRVRGVLLNIANLRSQPSGLKIHCNGEGDIQILNAPPADPFHAPRVTLDRLVLFDPEADPDHRKVSSGVVTFVDPGQFFYLLDGDASVRVDSGEKSVKPGDLVEVSGFIDTHSVLASFTEALVKVIGKGEVPVPEAITIASILNPKTRSWHEMVTEPGYPDRNGKLVRLSGILRRVLPVDKEGNVTLVVESENHIFQAFLPSAGARTEQSVSEWIEGSTVELTGVCELELSRIDDFPWFSIDGFQLRLSSPSNLRVITTPPWWTPRRFGILFAGLLLVLGLTLAWGYVMRRKVAVRSMQLAQEIAAREANTLKFDTILLERRRLAIDLHDTLEQALTGLALQLEITERSKVSDPELSARHLGLAQQFLECSRQEVHRTVWDLRANGLGGRDFLEILNKRTNDMLVGTSVEVNVTNEGLVFPLPDMIAGNLLLFAQEAVTNALKHGSPKKIDVHLKSTPDQVKLIIADDGSGFDIATAPGRNEGHFGLQGMHERLKRLGGELNIQTVRDQGTIITALVSIKAEEATKAT